MDRKRLKDPLVYLWSDYKWPLLAGAIVCLVAVYMLIHALTQKETVLSVMLIDCHAAISQEEMEKDALAALGCKDGKQQAEILTSLLFSEAGFATENEEFVFANTQGSMKKFFDWAMEQPLPEAVNGPSER